MTTPHTPGPFHYQEAGPRWGWDILDDSGLTVAQIGAVNSTEQAEAEPIARLIAAAPAMVDALRIAFAAIDDREHPNTAAVIRALLARIDGKETK